MGKNNYRFFTEEEDRVIIENYQKYGLAHVAKMLADRPQASIQQRARRLGVIVSKKNKDKVEESKVPTTPSKVTRKKSNKPPEWSKEEDYQIRKHSLSLSDDLIDALPGRSVQEIDKRIQQLNNRKYVSDEAYTYVSYPLNAYVDIYGTYLGYDKFHSNFEITLDTYLNNIIKANPSKPKLAEGITMAFLMRYRDHLPTYDISRELNVPEESVDKLCAQCIKILKRTMIKTK